MEIIGSKWKIPILWNLTHHDRLHYNELKRRVSGITNTMLTRALRELEESGLVVRAAEEVVPPSVIYCLTDMGKKLLPALDGLYAWGEEHQNMRMERGE